jgi:hypothetical protein
MSSYDQQMSPSSTNDGGSDDGNGNADERSGILSTSDD